MIIIVGACWNRQGGGVFGQCTYGVRGVKSVLSDGTTRWKEDGFQMGLVTESPAVKCRPRNFAWKGRICVRRFCAQLRARTNCEAGSEDLCTWSKDAGDLEGHARGGELVLGGEMNK